MASIDLAAPRFRPLGQAVTTSRLSVAPGLPSTSVATGCCSNANFAPPEQPSSCAISPEAAATDQRVRRLPSGSNSIDLSCAIRLGDSLPGHVPGAGVNFDAGIVWVLLLGMESSAESLAAGLFGEAGVAGEYPEGPWNLGVLSISSRGDGISDVSMADKSTVLTKV